MMKQRTTGILAICFAATLWGLDGVALTPRLFNLSVAFVVFLLHAVPFALIQPFLFKSYYALRRLPQSGWFALVGVATTGGVIGTLAIVKALFIVHFTQLSVVVLLQKLQPVFAIFLAALLLKERITKEFFIWAALAVFGAYILAFGFRAPDFSVGNSAAAAVYAIIAAAAFGAGTVFSKKLVGLLNFKEATFARFGMTSAIMLFYLLVTGTAFAFGDVTTTNWLIITVIALTTGSGAIFIYYWGLRHVPASVSTICELCLPLSAVIFDYLINGTILLPWQWAGALMMVAAILRISRLKLEEKRSYKERT